MSILPILIFVHILLMVFWLGSDVGVFISALRYIDPARPLAERKAVMDLGIVIDRYPRVCFVAMLPVGAQIAWLLGLLTFSATVMVLVWLLAAVWMGVVVGAIALAGQPVVKLLHLIERVLLVGTAVVLIASGVAGLSGRWGLPGWFAGKLVVFGCICVFALLLDWSFGAVVSAFGAVENEGSTPAREAALRTRMHRSLGWVLAIYASVLTAGFLGTVQP